MIVIDKSRWYVRLFLWFRRIQLKFWHQDPWECDCHEVYTNLCLFIRLLFFTGPLIVLLHVLAYGALLASVTVVPVYFFGWRGCCVPGGLLLLFLGVRLAVWWWRASKKEPVLDAHETVEVGPGLWSLLGTRIKASKRKICPLMILKEVKDE